MIDNKKRRQNINSRYYVPARMDGMDGSGQ